MGAYLLYQQVALQKVFNFSVSHIFETRVAGRMVADMCRAAVKVSSIVFLFLSCFVAQVVLKHSVFLPKFFSDGYGLNSSFRQYLLLRHIDLANKNSAASYFVTLEYLPKKKRQFIYTNTFSVLPGRILEALCSSLLRSYNTAYNE